MERQKYKSWQRELSVYDHIKEKSVSIAFPYINIIGYNLFNGSIAFGYNSTLE
jgi:hypothetical protein